MDTQSCRSGVKPGIIAEKMTATKYCESHDSWSMYNDPTSVTQITSKIRLIAMVNNKYDRSFFKYRTHGIPHDCKHTLVSITGAL